MAEPVVLLTMCLQKKYLIMKFFDHLDFIWNFSLSFSWLNGKMKTTIKNRKQKSKARFGWTMTYWNKNEKHSHVTIRNMKNRENRKKSRRITNRNNTHSAFIIFFYPFFMRYISNILHNSYPTKWWNFQMVESLDHELTVTQ